MNPPKALSPLARSVSELIAAYRKENAEAKEEGNEEGALDPTSVWTADEFLRVLEAAEEFAKEESGLGPK